MVAIRSAPTITAAATPAESFLILNCSPFFGCFPRNSFRGACDRVNEALAVSRERRRPAAEDLDGRSSPVRAAAARTVTHRLRAP
jgi:hypothetical protein